MAFVNTQNKNILRGWFLRRTQRPHTNPAHTKPAQCRNPAQVSSPGIFDNTKMQLRQESPRCGLFWRKSIVFGYGPFSRRGSAQCGADTRWYTVHFRVTVRPPAHSAQLTFTSTRPTRLLSIDSTVTVRFLYVKLSPGAG